MLKEGVEYKIKISFKVSLAAGAANLTVRGAGGHVWCHWQVNKEIVSGLKYIQTTSRKGVKGESSTAPLSSSFLTPLSY